MQKILIIDDLPDVLGVVAYVLSSAGYQVLQASNGAEGIEQAHSERPDLVLCDVMMPGINGYEVLRAIREDPATRTTPFIFLTAKDTRSDIRVGMEGGADDYLVKPFDLDELLNAVRAQLEKHAQFERRIEMLREGLSIVLPHELRTPLTLILAHSSALLESLGHLDREILVDSLVTINRSGERLRRLVENLLFYVELSGDQTMPLEFPSVSDVGEVVLEVARATASRQHRENDLQFHLEPGSARVHDFHVRKITEELVDDALKFSERDTPVRITVMHDSDGLRIVVSDRGRGITAEQLEQAGAWVQFDRKRYEQQGGGLGLAVVRRIASLYAGTLFVESVPEGGSLVGVRLVDV